MGRDSGANAQIVTFPIQAYVLVHGAINWVTLAQDCMAHFADESMRARFPKKKE